MGKKRVIAETGAGQHGVATATVAARSSACAARSTWARSTWSGSAERAAHAAAGRGGDPVGIGSRTLKDATGEAMRDWVTNVRDTHYILGSVVGPHPFPDDRARSSSR